MHRQDDLNLRMLCLKTFFYVTWPIYIALDKRGI